jgi:sulfonate transport system substrate-binding protein
MRTRPARFITLLAALALPIALLAGCGSSSASGSGTTSTTAGSVTTSSIPAGTVLRVGDQLKALETILSIGHQDQNFPYTVQYSQFVGGPTMLQAFEGGALDVGFVYSTPLIFAQSANQGLTAVAGWATKGSTYALVSAPGQTSIKSWASLKGKKVAYQAGTASEAVLLEGLQSAHLSLSDVTTVNLPTTEIAAALQGGSADAGITVEPLLSVYLAANPTAHVVTYSNNLTDKTSFLIASSSTLADKGKSAALADYISRLVKAYRYINAHPGVAAKAIYVDQYGLTPARAAQVSAETGTTTFLQLPGQIQAAQQNLADLFFDAKVIPAKIDVAQQFDPRFNSLVASVQGS